MKNWESTLIQPGASVLEVVKIIDSSTPLLTALVVDSEKKLLGTVTDGDIRRGILNNKTMTDPVEMIMNPKPVSISINDSEKKFQQITTLNKRCRIIPVLDEKARVVDIKLTTLVHTKTMNNPVLIMAGGLGTRLRPLTNDCPKPLLKVGKKPILEIILDNFIDHGFYDFYISINYKGEMIEDYFGDGSEKNISIKYVRETKQLGTAGSLSLLEKEPQQTIIVMNGDLLTKVNFQQLLDFHESNKSQATLCIREHDFQIPFGVADISDCNLTGLKEKPAYKVFVNAGIYALNPDIIKMIPNDKYYDMTDLFAALLQKNIKPTVFPVREYWMDIGRISEYERASEVYPTLFAED
jgi:dTDP-glucose pyrophosphorylase